MKSDLKRSLEFLGFSEEEIRIYLVCLEFGPIAVSGVSRLTKIGRVNAYHHIDKLKEKGLLTLSQKEKVKHYSATNPEVLRNQEKERMNLVEGILPQLMSLSIKNPKKPKIQFFEGRAGIQNIFDQMLVLENAEVVSFSNFERLAKFAPDFLKSHFKSRQEKKIKTRFISSRKSGGENFQKEIFPEDFEERLLEIFLLSSKEFHFESEITIFSNSIAIMDLDEDHPIGVLIENPELYRTQKAIFDLAWLGATSFITQ